MQLLKRQPRHAILSFAKYNWAINNHSELKDSCAENVGALNSDDLKTQISAIRSLAALCFLELNDPKGVSPELLRLFEELAVTSPLEEVRMESIDALYLARDITRLMSISAIFSVSESSEVSLYCSKAVSDLVKELRSSN